MVAGRGVVVGNLQVGGKITAIVATTNKNTVEFAHLVVAVHQDILPRNSKNCKKL